MKAEEEGINSDYLMKILMLGSTGVGKSCLLLRYVENSFFDDYFSTIGVDFKFKTIMLKNQVAKLQIWDTAGQERFRNITKFYYQGANGVVLVFDLTLRSSFEALDFWLEDVKKYASSRVCKVLLGNKADLEYEREVSSEEAEAYAEDHNMAYFETSAKEDFNVENSFFELALEIKGGMDNSSKRENNFVVVNARDKLTRVKCC